MSEVDVGQLAGSIENYSSCSYRSKRYPTPREAVRFTVFLVVDAYIFGTEPSILRYHISKVLRSTVKKKKHMAISIP